MKISCHGLDLQIDLSPPDEYGWMSARVTVKVPNFDGSFRCLIERPEWQVFVASLQQLQASIGSDAHASWGNIECNIDLEFSLEKLGGITGTYKFSPGSGDEPVLSGSFDADQTFLQQWITSAVESLDHER